MASLGNLTLFVACVFFLSRHSLESELDTCNIEFKTGKQTAGNFKSYTFSFVLMKQLNRSTNHLRDELAVSFVLNMEARK